MRFIGYVKERLYQAWIVFLILFTTEIFLLTVKGSMWIGIYLAVAGIFGWLLILYLEFRRKKEYFMEIMESMEALDQKYLIAEMLKRGERQEEILNKRILEEAGKSMVEQVNCYKFASEEYKEYIELWIHEVKLPIAAAKMMVENHRNKVTEDIEEELDKISGYTDQALFYARSNYVEKDYLINCVRLSDVVHLVLLQNKKMLIRKKAKINLHDLENNVSSDSKWLAFIFNQILSNSIKYADKETLEIEIYAKEEKECVRLFLVDNGMGIAEAELCRVFEKGFTGTKGRMFFGNSRNHATGMGLFLCRQLCKKLGHGIAVESKESVGTKVCITFPKGSMTEVNKA